MLGRTPLTCLSNITVARIIVNVVTRRHIHDQTEANLRVYLPCRSTFHTQTVMIDTFCEKKTMHGVDQTADKRPLTGVKERKKVV